MLVVVMMLLLAMVELNWATYFIIAVRLLFLLMVLMIFVARESQDASTHHPCCNLLLQLVLPVLFLFLRKIGAVRQVLDLRISTKFTLSFYMCVCYEKWRDDSDVATHVNSMVLLHIILT